MRVTVLAVAYIAVGLALVGGLAAKRGLDRKVAVKVMLSTAGSAAPSAR